MKNLVKTLLHKNVSAAQIAGYALANLVGLAIVLTAIKFYSDVNKILSGAESVVPSSYIVLSKHVKALGGGDLAFDEEEIADLQSQPWMKDLGKFVPSQFSVNAMVNVGGRGMSTSLFFEAIPDRFIDVKPSTWHYDPGSRTVPIILPKDYLSLYNFGFASSQGLPTVSEEMIKIFSISLSLSGNGRQEYFTGRIVGFSSRLNTIAVPEKFMEYANAIFTEGETPATRLIVEVSRPGDPEVENYISEKGYDTDSGSESADKAHFFLLLLTSILITIGIVISCLALFILLLSLHLLLQKNKDKIHSLMMLGFKPSEICRHYYNIVIAVNIAVYIISVAIMLIASHLWTSILSQTGLKSASPLTACAIGFLIIFVITMVNLFTINRNVKRSFYKH